MLVVFFNLLFLALLGVAWRETASALRVQSVRDVQARCDQGTIPALAMAIELLETGSPPSDPYVCVASIDTADGLRDFTVTFTGEGENQWAIHAAATASGENPSPMPETFVVDE